MTRRNLLGIVATLAFLTAACSSAPDAQGLRDSFAKQLETNKFVEKFERNGDDITFIGPGADGGTVTWRVHLDSAVVEPNDDPAQPFKGTVKSSWLSNGTPVTPLGRESNLPVELISNGLSQDCWALWDPQAKSWGWE